MTCPTARALPDKRKHVGQRGLSANFHADGQQFDALLADLLSEAVNLDADKRTELEVPSPLHERVAGVEPEEFRVIIQADHPEDAH